jgi:DNA helicase-2/ATP-dependent DNA helicase PcrA
LADKSFPSEGKKSDSWLSNAGSIPVSLRGDYDQLPTINFDNFTSNKSLKAGLNRFTNQWKERKLVEEFRLAYVAITRAKKGLLCTTSHFRTGNQPVDPSKLFEIFTEASKKIRGASIINQVDVPDGINPIKENPKTSNWPKSNEKLIKLRKIAEITQQARPIDIEQTLLENISENQRSILLDMQALINQIKNKQDFLKVVLPTRLSVSTLLYLAKEPHELALRIRRPMPNHIDKYARRGTEFHLWLENHFQHPALISVDELFNQNLMSTEHDAPLEVLQKAWLSSQWADKTPIDIEFGFETMIDSTLVRGRIDAVYKVGADKYEVVDWKTGKVKSGDDLAVAAIQLAMYRLAYSKLKSLPVENISAAFHYVADNQTVRPADILTQEQLKELIVRVPVEI